MQKSLLHALVGLILGGFATASALWWLDEVKWPVVAAAAGLCGLLAFVCGASFLEWLLTIFGEF